MDSFLAWVPTITGNLSFATIGSAKIPNKVFGVSRDFNGVRFVALSQKRRTTDAQFNKIGNALNLLREREGQSVYTLLGKKGESEGRTTFSGVCINLIPEQYEHFKNSLNLLLENNLSAQSFEDTFNNISTEILDRMINFKGCAAKFELDRDGKIEIEILICNQGEAEDVASQMFFFIRDMCHNHQHHTPTSDTIIDVVPKSDGEDAWRRETLYSLNRWIIQRKRTKSILAYMDAKGVLAYARAFTELHCLKSEDGEQFPKFLWNETSDSLDAGLAKAKYGREEKERISTVVFNRILPVVVVFFLLLGTFTDAINQSGLTSQELIAFKIADFFSKNIIIFCALIVGIIFYEFRSRLSRQLKFDIFRVLMIFRFRDVFVILIAFLLALIAIGYYFVRFLS